MKLKLLSMICLWILFSANISAQTSIQITFAEDSFYTAHCPTPLTIPFTLSGLCTGYDPLADHISLEINFGDGNDTLFQVAITGAFFGDYFYSYFVHTYNFAGVYAVKYTATGPDGNADTLIHNSELVVSDTCGNISGRVYLDTDGDCIYDNNDLVESYLPVHLYENGIYVQSSYTDANGTYWFSAPNGLDFDIVMDTSLFIPNGYVISCPQAGIYSVTAPASGNDFGLICDTAVYTSYDLYGGVSGTYGGMKLCPGKIGYLYPFAANHSCIPASGIAKLIIDNPEIHYLSSSPPPDFVSGDTLMWNFTAFNNYSFWNFWNYTLSTVSYLTDSFAVIGDNVCFTLILEPILGDQDPSNNISIYCDTISSSYDPNFKTVMPKGEGLQGNIFSNTELTYTVHFQNTGTAAAENIFILDTLDADLNLATFRPVMSSHPVTFDLLGNVVKFSFNNIQLPDSATNEAQSQGFVSYTIDMNTGLPEGTQITNEAGIYFDFNSVVMTNQTLNTIDLHLGIPLIEVRDDSFDIFPNPASTDITVMLSEADGEISIENLTGKNMLQKQVTSKVMNVDISLLPSGIYFITVKNGNYISSKKLVVGR